MRPGLSRGGPPGSVVPARQSGRAGEDAGLVALFRGSADGRGALPLVQPGLLKVLRRAARGTIRPRGRAAAASQALLSEDGTKGIFRTAHPTFDAADRQDRTPDPP